MGVTHAGLVNRADSSSTYAALYPELYRLLARRRQPEDERVTPQGWSVLQHLELSGPLTIQELKQHLCRAQSVASDMVAALERSGLLVRMKDPADRRRTLVWLSDQGSDFLRRLRDVLDREALARCMADLSDSDCQALLHGTSALVRAAETARRRELREVCAAEKNPRQQPRSQKR